MSTTSAPTTAIATPTAAPATGTSPVRLAAGLALIAFPVLLVAGVATSPPQASDAPADYVASLGTDPGLTALSAGLLHYSWVAFALGVLAIIGLVRGPRGRVVVPLAAIVTSFSAIQLSGLLLSDWFTGAAARAMPLEAATALTEGVWADPWVSTWTISGRVVGFVGIPLVIAALARAGVVSWWLLGVSVIGFAGFVVPGTYGVLAGMAVATAPMIVVGVRLIQRAAARVRREELAAA
ncbi:hypothetical protein Acsp06_04980 [Actinomycetospora sp. NBRC 106375]|uniref:hypothetical protein n=1 Tax=Actinomycetospora sp. NBRC 106375 TaxID=3032207 RepID=UPI0024A17225|nr:hypothetical protein [Actinomycetospora sp. NBRC 106375]GLZ44313.1 hypothetical protein Acsp06_04980 [Actinomycetospora sp. NBRC 106375]